MAHARPVSRRPRNLPDLAGSAGDSGRNPRRVHLSRHPRRLGRRRRLHSAAVRDRSGVCISLPTIQRGHIRPGVVLRDQSGRDRADRAFVLQAREDCAQGSVAVGHRRNRGADHGLGAGRDCPVVHWGRYGRDVAVRRTRAGEDRSINVHARDRGRRRGWWSPPSEFAAVLHQSWLLHVWQRPRDRAVFAAGCRFTAALAE